MKRTLVFLSLALFSAACTQDPAEVSYKGDEFFGRVHEGALDSPNHETFSENSPRIKMGYARPVAPATVQSVGVSDLAPPSATPQSNPPVKAQQTSSTEDAAPPPAKASHGPQGQGKAQFIWPVEGGKIISRFGPKAAGRSNDGINIAVTEGEPIWAASAGTVVYAGSDLKGYGNMVILRHDGGWMTAYAHMRSIGVKKGDVEKQGDIIGYVGQSGGVKEPQLHFAIRNGKTPVDPELYLAKNTASGQ